MKRIISSLIIIFSFFSMLLVTSCNNNENEEEETVPYKLVIDCSEIVSNLDNESYAVKAEKRDIVPENGIVLEKEGKCNEGTTAYDLVVSVLKKNKIHFDGTGVYFKGIGNLYEGDCGQFSGWMFFINGNLAELGASDTIVKADDVIEFRYIVDYNILFEFH